MTAHDPKISDSKPATEPEFDRKQIVKLLIELGPLLTLFIANWIAGKTSNPGQAIFWATGAFMIATAVSLVASRIVFGHIAKMPLVTAALVAVFGGLTLWLQDDLFIKVKPTILFCLFGLILIGGLISGRFFLKAAFGEALQLSDEGWRVLTLRWSVFFFALAALNELVWRHFSTDFWIGYKVFGVMPLMIVFAMLQIFSLKKYEKPSQNEENNT